MSAGLLLCWAAVTTSQRPAANDARQPPAAVAPAGQPAQAADSSAIRTRFGPTTIRYRLVRDPFFSPYFSGVYPAFGFSQVYSEVFAFGPPGTVFAGQYGFGGFTPFAVEPVPIVVLPPPVIFVPPPVVVVPPPAAFAPRAELFNPRAPSPLIAPAAPRGETTDIPKRLVDQLVHRARPTLAQRAQAARLEGSGDRLFRDGHFDRAAERYQQALAQTPDNEELSFKRGEALIGVGRYDEAGRVLRDALRERPDWPFVAHDLRKFFPDEDSIRRTLEALRREAQKPTADPDVPFLEAYIHYFSGQREAAEPIFRNPPEGGPVRHFQIFVDAIDRQRGAK